MERTDSIFRTSAFIALAIFVSACGFTEVPLDRLTPGSRIAVTAPVNGTSKSMQMKTSTIESMLDLSFDPREGPFDDPEGIPLLELLRNVFADALYARGFDAWPVSSFGEDVPRASLSGDEGFQEFVRGLADEGYDYVLLSAVTDYERFEDELRLDSIRIGAYFVFVDANTREPVIESNIEAMEYHFSALDVEDFAYWGLNEIEWFFRKFAADSFGVGVSRSERKLGNAD
ncbi:MAG: hypothetical protein NUW37_17075 [Planctomycetes bacterium]|nr:hypothetical protein [Planctomycetota bacterium]